MGFLDRYNEELGALRRRAGAFARKHPKIAGRLRMTPETVDDPHVERMLQGFAFSAARVRQKLDDDFPELTDALLEALYPQYLAPIPSMSVVRLEPAAALDEVLHLPRGFDVTTEAVRGDRCIYRTAMPLELAPVPVEGAKLQRAPFAAPEATHLKARSCLSIELRTPIGFGELEGWNPVFHVRGPLGEAARLFEHVRNGTLGVALAPHADVPPAEVAWLSADAIEPVGFEEEEAALPFPPRSFPGFRLLTEFFALPEKFLFFRVRLPRGLARFGGRLTLFVYGGPNPDRLIPLVGAETFDLHCAPVVNLFPQRAEPIHVDRTRHEYDIVTDSRFHATREVHSVKRVMLTGGNGRTEEVLPFFGRRPLTAENRAGVFWQHKRIVEEDGIAISRLALVDLSLNAATPQDNTVASVDAMCLNRTLPEQLPFGGGQPYLSVSQHADRIARAEMLLAPTPTTRFDRGDGATWRLLAHLALNHLALTAGDPELLRDMLRLYDYRGVQETGTLIDALSAVESERGTARLPDGSVVSGVDVSVTFDGDLLDRGQAYLVGSVLSRFLGLYASINTFSRLTVRLSGIVTPVVRFEPRTASEALL